MTRLTGQSSRPARTADGKPNFSWRLAGCINEANWDLQAHEARPGAGDAAGRLSVRMREVPAAPVLALGAAAGVPGLARRRAGRRRRFPQPAAAAMQKATTRRTGSTAIRSSKCYLPGIPRATYMPLSVSDRPERRTRSRWSTFSERGPHDSSGQGRGPPRRHLDGPLGRPLGRRHAGRRRDELQRQDLVSTEPGNFHSDALHVVERFTPITAGRAPLRSDDRGSEGLHAPVDDCDADLSPAGAEHPAPRLPCIEFTEEFACGNLRKQQLVKHWEGETIAVDITRKVPPGERPRLMAVRRTTRGECKQ